MAEEALIKTERAPLNCWRLLWLSISIPSCWLADSLTSQQQKLVFSASFLKKDCRRPDSLMLTQIDIKPYIPTETIKKKQSAEVTFVSSGNYEHEPPGRGS